MEPYSIVQHIKIALLFGIVGLLINLLCATFGYFKFPPYPPQPSRLMFKHIAAAFIIYLGIPFALPSIVYHFIAHTQTNPVVQATIFEGLYIALTAGFLSILLFSSRRLKMKPIWKEGSLTSIPNDIFLGIATYFIAIPLVISAGELASAFNHVVFGREGAEQLAVRYLKLVMYHPYLLIIAVVVILICAPILEELLFRGLLLTWLRNKVGTKAAILLSALTFGFFHFSPSQGVANIPLIVSLTLFAIYLGFLYEKRRSLFAPIALHMTFNSISVIRILFFNGGIS